jgi:DHA2 family multidrug resistance protein
MAVLDIQITNASLREITGGIGSTAVEASWVSTSYLIGEIITIPLTAWLGRVFGVRLYLLVNVSLFLVFSGLCGTAGELTQMIIYRALQGFTGGVMIPMSFTVINTQLPPTLAVIFIPLFIICELVSKTPVVNLRLLRIRNWTRLRRQTLVSLLARPTCSKRSR